MSLAGRRIGFLGGGAMAEALVGGLVAAGSDPSQLRAADPDAGRREALEKALAIATTGDNAELVAGSDVVVLAVKPGIVAPALEALRDGADTGAPLWISIAAGVPLAKLEAALGGSPRVVRAMPNTPALVRAGATAFVGNAHAGSDDLAAARELFECVGSAWQAPDEALLDAVTGLSGSGPAYLFRFLEALAEAGVAVGLPREAAVALAEQTVYGAALLARQSERSPAELRAQVSSPGGTTLAGLERLDAEGFSRAVAEAVAAATRRSKQLGEG